ncbi:MAG TPA: hypothetical protein VJS85_09145 [Rhizomicrobium sp.]|nr:hypothetical protein [Rhizomicrobium sp.]
MVANRAAGKFSENCVARNNPELDRLSVTDCPVHALSASASPAEWVEMAWAARDATLASRNLERRGWFEGVKCLLFEQDLPASRVCGRISTPHKASKR